MIKGQSIIGKPVLSRADGEKLDSVKDIVIGKDHTHVIALLISEGGIFSKATVVLLENVVSYGKDAVMITSSDAAVRADRVPAVAEALDMDEKLNGKKVFTETGEESGRLSDIFFDEKTGSIVGVDVTELVQGSSPKTVAYLDAADIISFGADAVVVSAGAAHKLTGPVATPVPDAGGITTIAPPPGDSGDMPNFAEMTMPSVSTTDAPAPMARLSEKQTDNLQLGEDGEGPKTS